MSLNWSIRDIADYENACFETADRDNPGRGVKKGEQLMRPVTNTLIWATIPVGIGRITEANYQTFALRLRLYEQLFGAFLRRRVDVNGQEVEDPFDDRPGRWVDRRITAAEVKAHIGLSTNASRLTTAQFKTQCWERAMREAKASVGYDSRRAAEAAA
jgi:hypothetical protein